ncbi:UTP20 [[Candida] subhashii]|uniref:UTP20 n=1 Tax=[Candida] subhashii TaxID=561895 RepID=A0A8J5QPZ9_9ASCO|nr:UTP20 [[Candida] subhashii]KAG7664571.1 UTP20 [[Candida] subhashii]
MSRPVKVKTTESSRRHAFSSFRERVDSIKIEPSKKLTKRAHDYVESSHFLTTLDHWKEINLSGNFTDFLDKVELYSQSLPQIIHHQKLIYDSLYSAIEINDINSIQPLLELLSQFIHDLGPDFLPYYQSMLKLLTNLIMNIDPNDYQNNRNSSNAFEWSFNTLAFAFKYLSRYLIEDLKPTFTTLLPILTITKKLYISRFCSEALSFLIRKSNNLKDIIIFTLYDQIDHIMTIDSYCDSLTILYSESMKNTKGTFHSKSNQIFATLIETTLYQLDSSNHEKAQPKLISIISDILLDILHHGTPESCDKFYILVTNYLNTLLDKDSSKIALLTSCQILSTLVFADSGKKITTWQPLLETTDKLSILLLKQTNNDAELCESYVYLLTILFRNADVQNLTKYHKRFFDSIINLNNGNYFLTFAQSSLNICKPKVTNFGLNKYIQEFIDKLQPTDESKLIKLTYFLQKIKVSIPDFPTSFKFPLQVVDEINNQLSRDVLSIEESVEKLQDIYWKLLMLNQAHSSVNITESELLDLLTKLGEPSYTFKSHFSKELAAAVLAITTQKLVNNKNEQSCLQVYEFLQQSFERFATSSTFLQAMNEFIKSTSTTIPSPEIIESLLNQAVTCLHLPSHTSRSNAIQVIISLLSISNTNSTCIDTIGTIESVPLTIPNARDITLRIRTLCQEFSKQINNPSELDKTIIINYLFGLLSNRFMPCWEGVWEGLPLLVQSCRLEIWEIGSRLLSMDYTNQDHDFMGGDSDAFEDEANGLNEWQPRNPRALGNFIGFEKEHLGIYRNIQVSLIELVRSQCGNNIYEDLLRSNILTGFGKVINVVEKHADDLIPLLIHNNNDESSSQTWSLKHRNELLALFVKFKKLNKAKLATELYDYLFNHLLSSQHTKIQQLALDVLFNYNKPEIVKYRDNLKNLLDETIFRDELSKFLSQESSIIEANDKRAVMSYVVRILFGRVQGSTKSNSKSGRKFAVISVLPNFNDEDIVEFISLGSTKIGYLDFFAGKTPKASLGLEKGSLKKMSGFINLLTEVYDTLGANYSEVLKTTIEPLVFCLISAQNRIESNIQEDNDAEQDDEVSGKVARNVRSGGMKCLGELFKIIGPSFDWNPYVNIIYEHLIMPRLTNFAVENLQSPSALLGVMTNWINTPNSLCFLYVDDYAPVKALLSILAKTELAKETVVSKVLDFVIAALKRSDAMDEDYFTLLAIVVDCLLGNLSNIIVNITHKEVGSKAIQALLLLISGKYIDDQETKASLIKSLTLALDKNNNQIDMADKANILISLSSLIENYDCEFKDMVGLYQTCSKLFRIFSDRKIRETLVGVLVAMGAKFDYIKEISVIIHDLNAYSTSRMQELDYETRLDAFKLINEEKYSTFDAIQWTPIVYCALYFINDPEELAIRVNAGYTLRRFIDCYSGKETGELAQPYITILKNVILPNLRVGIRKDNEDIQNEYIGVLEHLVSKSNWFVDLKDMQVLTYNDHDETNFFKNVNHIQLHRRQRAIKRLAEHGKDLSDSSIAHYILPIIERYVVSTDEKFTNIGMEALDTIGVLLKYINWNQYRAILKRYVATLKSNDQDVLKYRVNLVVAVSDALATSIESKNNGEPNYIKSLPSAQEDIDDFILNEACPSLLKILNVRDDETIVSRAPLAEALTNFILCITKEKIDSELPKILTSTSQVMRSRSEELRDAVRKTLGKIATRLGSHYLPFIVQELKGALSRGSQIHVLSYTLHYLLTCLASRSGGLQHGDLDLSIELIIEIVMEDIFGAAGQEKDAEGYTSKMKEVKFKKSFDTTEILSGNITLSKFGDLINPIKLILSENITYKTQTKLDELLRRLSLGLNHNSEASKVEILHLCYEIYMSSTEKELQQQQPRNGPTAKEQHFLTTLKRITKTHVDNSIFKHTMQRLSLELLRTAISRHDNLLTVANLEGFVPLLDESIRSENDAVIASGLKILNSIVRLPFGEESQNVFKACARRSLVIIKDSPSTNSDVCQAALKFLATIIRHNPDVNLKETAISYVLTRIQPDLEEPNRQGLAFNFLKAVVSQHILIPEIYDLMNNVAKLMIVNHAKEIRDMSRSVYFQFLMEYDQGRGRLEKQFKYLVNNLTYPTEEGRQSVMELIHLIVMKAGGDLLEKLSSSFFVALASVLVSDSAHKCREMASALIGSMFKKLEGKTTSLQNVEKYCMAWLKQNSNPLLKRCGFSVYKIIVNVFGLGKFEELDKIAHENILFVINSAKNTEDNGGGDVEWELLYSALSTFSAIASSTKEKILGEQYGSIWHSLVEIMLFPHSWVRLLSSRLVAILLTNLDDLGFEVSGFEVQTIAFRLIHQLRAPGITEDLGLQVTKNLVMIAMRWETNGTKLEINDEEEEEEGDSKRDTYANDYLLRRICGIIKQESLQSITSKKACIKLAAMFIQFTTEERLHQVSEMIIGALYNFTDAEYSKSLTDEELTSLSLESLELIQQKIGTTEYTKIYAQVQRSVSLRRQERRAKRAQLAVSLPDAAAKRKLRKHERFREKRKHEKDINGFYKSKKKRV